MDGRVMGKWKKMEQEKRNDGWENDVSGKESGRVIENVRCVEC